MFHTHQPLLTPLSDVPSDIGLLRFAALAVSNRSSRLYHQLILALSCFSHPTHADRYLGGQHNIEPRLSGTATGQTLKLFPRFRASSWSAADTSTLCRMHQHHLPTCKASAKGVILHGAEVPRKARSGIRHSRSATMAEVEF